MSRLLFSILFVVALGTAWNVYPQRERHSDEKIPLLEARINTLEKKLDTTSGKQSDLKSDLDRLNKEVIEMKSHLNMKTEHNRRSNLIAALLLLAGLLLEIVGAIFAASEILTKKIRLNRNLNSRVSSNDLGLENTAIKEVTGFLTTLGVILVFSGFILQSSGTLIILELVFWWWLGAGFLLAAIAGLIVYFVAGRNLDQSASEKAKILILSSYYSFVSPLIFGFWRLVGGELCDYCRKPVSSKNLFISFYFEQNSDDYPFLHTPCQFLLGHRECLLKGQGEELQRLNTADQKGKYAPAQNLLKKKEFLSWAEPMNEWHQRWREYWAKSRENDLGDGSWYKDLQRILKRI